MTCFTSSSAPEETTEKAHDYSHKSIDNFKMIIVIQSKNITYPVKRSVMNYFDLLLNINVYLLTQREF